MSERRARSEKQKINDVLCATRMKAYHAELKKLKEARIIEETKQEYKNSRPLKIKGKAKSVKEELALIENFESDSITPLKNEPDELDIPKRQKRAYNKKSKIVEPSETLMYF
jgi:hypothetical protein